MDAIAAFIGAFVGSLTACLYFLYFIFPHTVQSRGIKLSLPVKKSKPAGTILKSPTPEEERVRKAKEFEERVYKIREQITDDFR